MGVYRQGRDRPTFDTDIVLIRQHVGLGDQRGRDDTPQAYRVLLSDRDTPPDGPTDPPPADGRAVPSLSGQWRAWWPTPNLSDSTYFLEDPPKIDLPVLPDIQRPFVWGVRGEVRPNSTWSKPFVQAIFVQADMKPMKTADAIVDRAELAITRLSLVVQGASLDSIQDSELPFAKAWKIRINGASMDVEEALPMQDRRLWRIVAVDRR